MSQLHQPSHIVVIDRNRLFREKIAFLLSQDVDHSYEVIANFETIDAGLELLQTHSIALLLVEAALLVEHVQLNLLKSLLKKCPQLRVILLTSGNQPFLQAKIDLLDIDHTMTKTIATGELLECISKVLHKNIHQSESLSYLEDLTPRELEILEWLVKGDSNKEIARELSISESTVKVHVQNILKKFKVSSRVEAAVYAVRNELSL